MKPSVYVAGPLGFSEVGRLYHNTVFVPMLEGSGFSVIDPWNLTPDSVIGEAESIPYGPDRRREWKRVNRIIGANNAAGIRAADLVVAVLDGTDVDSGTASEIGYAYALNKTVIGYRGDFRLSADNDGSTVNLQVQYFIESSGGEIYSSIDNLRIGLYVWIKGREPGPLNPLQYIAVSHELKA
jgi:nucleoside 2-deoxyribosyltransferase